MQSQAIPYNPALLRWARDNAGLSLHEAVFRAKIKPPRQSDNKECFTPEDRLSSWEEGIASPTLSQLEALAKAYRRPLVTFFLSNPPSQVNPLMDYRTTCNVSNASPEFAALKRRIIQLHRELTAIAKEEQAKTLDFVGSCSTQNGVTATVEAIQKTLDIAPMRKQHSHNDDAFITLRAKAHVAGIYVILMGDLGSHHSAVSTDEFRGIAIADKLTPLVVINNHDVKVAMPFTLAHELTHIFLGNSGISNQFMFTTPQRHEQTEYFCNAVAAELLVPEKVLRSVWNNQHGKLVDFIKRLTRNFHVSEEVIARRLHDISLIDTIDYRELVAMYEARWMRLKDKNRSINSGPNANVVARYNIGDKTLGTLLRAADNGTISLQDAARALNISVGRLERIVG